MRHLRLITIAEPTMADDEPTAPDQEITSAVEQRLDRVRFDLHDGPQQDVHLLAQDLKLFRDQILAIIESDPNRDRIVGRLDDLQAELSALDDSLRALSTSLTAPSLGPGSMADALAEIIGAFAGRTGIAPEIQLGGDLESLADLEQIALLAVVREALSNVRKHGDATTVSVSVSAGDDWAAAEVVDDGRGFDPDTRLREARLDGHLGVVGMHERVRLLGGETRIDSRPGGPTVVSASIPRIRPAV
jgi:two-component system, NarL family, sensor kinase